MRRCKRCFLSENFPNINLNEKRICNYCLKGVVNAKDIGDEETIKLRKKKLKKEFEEYFKSIKGKNEYDCLLLFIGGKDSTYLLYLLKEKYGLNVLTLTVNNGLEPDCTKKNIKRVIKHFKVDHIFFRTNFHKKMYKYLLSKPTKEPLCKLICGSCAKIMQSTGLYVATEKKIPFVVLGYSPDQAHFLEFSKDKLLESWVPDELYNEYFSDKDRNYFWNPKNVNKKDIPRFIIPFYTIDYQGLEEIIKKLKELGLGSMKNLHPLKSNCHMMWLLMRIDLVKHGYIQLNASTSSMIRNSKIKGRKRYYLILTLGFWLFKHGLVKQKLIKNALNYVDLKNVNVI